MEILLNTLAVALGHHHRVGQLVGGGPFVEMKGIATRNSAFAKTHPHLAKFGSFLDELNAETQRGAALTATAMLETILHDILESFLITGKVSTDLLDGFNAPLGTLAAKEKMARAMGLISEREYNEAEVIRKIRNEFAHSVHISFDSDKVLALCKRLTMHAKPYGDMTWNARSAFASSAVSLILNLTNRAFYVGKKRLEYGNWKT